MGSHISQAQQFMLQQQNNKSISVTQLSKWTPLYSLVSVTGGEGETGGAHWLRGSEKWTTISKMLPQFQRQRQENVTNHMLLLKPAPKGYHHFCSQGVARNQQADWPHPT